MRPILKNTAAIFLAIPMVMSLAALRPSLPRARANSDQKATEASSPGGEGKDRELVAQLASKSIRIEFDQLMRSRVLAIVDGKETPLGPFSWSETVVIKSVEGRSERREFPLNYQRNEVVNDKFGKGHRLVVAGESGGLKKTVSVTIYDEFPTMAVFAVDYTNRGMNPIEVENWKNNGYRIVANSGVQPAFWSYQSGSYERRPNWVLPLKVGFKQENYQGMNASDYGGGTPVVDVWRRDVGLAVGHVERVPHLVSLPITMPDARAATLAVTMSKKATLAPQESLHTLNTFVAVHHGDYYATLLEYRRFMMRQGFEMADAPESAFSPIWCAWGYNRHFKLEQVYDTLPTVKKMGFAWVTLDDGWQNNYGDWQLDPKKFPHGDADMKAFVDRVHEEGFKAQLWWSPLQASPGSALLKEHPELVLLNKNLTERKISWWNSVYLCPAENTVVELQTAIVKKILVDWGFDGLKLDGQHMNAVPECFNPAHHHQSPEDSVEAVPEFFRAIYETARRVKPDALVEFCPCGTAFSFFTMPHFNMSVASDPESSFQVRSKGKTLKALMGDQIPYFGDHVELSDGGTDFASTVGVGGVVGTQFVLPGLVKKHGQFDLTPAREKLFTKWVAIYKEKMLSHGAYLGTLYDIGFDKPEAHAIRKDDEMYYAFFAKRWDGKIELRGLRDANYELFDYENGKTLGKVHGPTAELPVKFDRHLMVEAKPE
jgi:alpha-galactosidase